MPRSSVNIGLIADDFTGAMDSGAQFARLGLPTHLGLTEVGEGSVEIIDTASRELAEMEAAECCRQAARRLAGRKLFKKIDSTLRGHVGSEIEAVLQVANYRKAVICPAAPLQGRVVLDGQLFVDNCLLHNSSFQNDPSFPVQTALISKIINRPVAYLSLQAVRQPDSVLTRTIAAMPEAIVIADAETQDDLSNISRAVIHGNFLPCGAFGLAQAWAQELSGQKPALPPPELPHGRGTALVIIGSANAVTHIQVQAITRQGQDLVWKIQSQLSEEQEEFLLEQITSSWPEHGARVLCPAQKEVVPDEAGRNISHIVSQLGAKLLQRVQPAYLVIVGGETAHHLCKLLRVNAVEILGEVEPGIPYGRFIGGSTDGMLVITKAGGFGDPNCLTRILFPKL